MKIKTQKPIIIDAEFNEKTGDIPSFEEQIQERTRNVNVDDDNLDISILLIVIGLVFMIAVVLFHPTTQEKVRGNHSTIIYRCKSW